MNTPQSLHSSWLSRSINALANLFDYEAVSLKNLLQVLGGPEMPYDLVSFFVSSFISSGKRPFFVQVGANDGVRDDRFGTLISNFNLSGIMVEPSPTPFKRLASLYSSNERISCKNVAIVDSDQNAEVTLYAFADEYCPPHQLSVFTSFERSHLARWKTILNLASEIQEIRVPALSLERLLSAHGRESCDLLVVDTEGYDDKIILSALQLKIKPRMMLFETINLKKRSFVNLLQALHRLEYITINLGNDSLAVNKDFFRIEATSDIVRNVN